MFGSASLEEAVDTKCTKNIHQKIGRGALCSACDLRELPFLKKKKRHWHPRMHACPDRPAICAPSKSQEVLGIFYLCGADQPRGRRWYANGASFYSNGPIAAATGDNTRRKRHLKKILHTSRAKKAHFPFLRVCVCMCEASHLCTSLQINLRVHSLCVSRKEMLRHAGLALARVTYTRTLAPKP